MGWTRPSGHIIRDFAAVLLLVGPQRFRRDRCKLGAFLLQLCATRNHGRPMFYAGHAVARALHHRFVFLPALGRPIRACKIDIINRERVLYLVVDFGQIAEHYNWRAAGLSRISAFQNTATPARSSISKYSSVDLRGDRAFTLRTLVRTRLPNRVAIFAESILRC